MEIDASIDALNLLVTASLNMLCSNSLFYALIQIMINFPHQISKLFLLSLFVCHHKPSDLLDFSNSIHLISLSLSLKLATKTQKQSLMLRFTNCSMNGSLSHAYGKLHENSATQLSGNPATQKTCAHCVFSSFHFSCPYYCIIPFLIPGHSIFEIF